MSGLSDSDNQFVEAEAPGQPEAVVSRRILLIDADTSFRKELRLNCEQYGYQVVEAETAADGLREFEEKQPSLVVLDVVLPDGSGFDLCRTIRRQDARVPVLIVSSRGEEIDVVVGLEIGADDYVIKPARTRELLARIAAHLRKARLDTQDTSPAPLQLKDLASDINERRSLKDGQEPELGPSVLGL